MRLHNLKGLKTLMVVQEVSQRRLARAAGYKSHAYMGRLMRGEVDTLEPEAALRIARFLQVDAEFLFAPRPSPADAHSAHRRIASLAPTSERPSPPLATFQVPLAATVHRAHESKGRHR